MNMESKHLRSDGRRHNELRPVKITTAMFDYPEGSALVDWQDASSVRRERSTAFLVGWKVRVAAG